MARLRYNGLSTALGASLTNSATSVTFGAALTYGGGTSVPTISGSDYIPLSILSSTGRLSEIVYLTAYTSGATTGTITRGQEGTTGGAHSSGDKVTHGPLVFDVASTLAVMKPADETVTSSTTLQNDDHLFVTVGANETWMFTCYLHLSSTSASPDIKMQAFGPSGATVQRVGVIGPASSSTSTEGGSHFQSHTTGALQVGVFDAAVTEAFAIFEAVVTVGATAGSIGLQWAQQNSNAAGTTIRQYSSLVANRLA